VPVNGTKLVFTQFSEFVVLKEFFDWLEARSACDNIKEKRLLREGQGPGQSSVELMTIVYQRHTGAEGLVALTNPEPSSCIVDGVMNPRPAHR